MLKDDKRGLSQVAKVLFLSGICANAGGVELVAVPGGVTEHIAVSADVVPAAAVFDPLVVEKFLAIKLTQIVKVFLTENQLELDEEDNKTLEKYNLLDLYYSIINNCSNMLLQVFNKYYVGIDLENE